MGVDLTANNYELVRASYTAADQTYGEVRPGFVLQPIDNAGLGRIQPWETPPGFVIKNVTIDNGYGGKFVIYKNEATNTVLVNSIGTNGTEDAVGWYTNFTSYGLQQWRDGDVKQDVLNALNEFVNGSTQVVLGGDSKGVMLSQVLLYDFVKDRDKGVFLPDELGLSNLAALGNDRLAIVGRNGAGIADYLARQEGQAFDPTWSQFAGVSTEYEKWGRSHF